MNDPRLMAAMELDRAAARWWELADEATERCAEAKRLSREIREQVEQEQEVEHLQEIADAQLVRFPRRKRAGGPRRAG